MSSFNGSSLILDSVPITTVYTDAFDAVAGGYCESDWLYCNWSTNYPQMEDSHINVKELCAVVLSAQRWCHQWANKRVLVRSDNIATVSWANRVTTRSPLIMTLIRYMFWLSAAFNFRLLLLLFLWLFPSSGVAAMVVGSLFPVFNFRIVALHVPGSDNVIADKISLLHEPYSQHYLYDLLVGSTLAWHILTTNLAAVVCVYVDVCQCAKVDKFLPERSHFESKRSENFVRIAKFPYAAFGPVFAFHCPLFFLRETMI